MWIIAAWLLVALIHTPPALAAFSPRLRARMYRVEETPTLAVILAHRGVLFLAGALIMVYNLWRTARGDVSAEEEPLLRPAYARTAPAE